MPRSLLIYLPGAIFLILVCAQSGLSQDRPSNKERDHLLTVLKTSKPDTNRVNILLNLGQYYLDKPLELKADSDSATAYTIQAERLSDKLGNKENRATAYHIQVLLKVGTFFYQKPQSLQADIDRGMFYARQAERLSLTDHPSLVPRSLEVLGKLYWEQNDTTSAKPYFTRAIKLYEQYKDTARLASIWFSIGDHYPHSKQTYAQKANGYKQAFTYFHQLKDQENEMKMVDYINYTYQLQSQIDQSLAAILTILRLYKAENYTLLDYINSCAAYIELDKGNYQSSTRYLMQAIQLAQSKHETTRIGEYYEQLSGIYLLLGDVDQRFDYAQKALFYYKKNNNLLNIHKEAGQICEILTRKKKGAEALSFYQNLLRQYPPASDQMQIHVDRNLAYIYESLQQYKRAEFHFLRFIDDLKNYNNGDPIKYSAYKMVSNFYLNQKQYAKSRYYLTQYFTIVKQVNQPRALMLSYESFFKLDSAQGDFQSALTDFQQYTAIKDSILTVTKARQISELQIQYETKNKENRINLLTAQSSEQQTRIQQANLTRNVTFGGASMLLLLLGLIYNRYRLKQTQQAQIQVKNLALEELVGQKEWLLKEIHHRVKNNLQLIISLLQSQGKYLLDKSAISAIEQSEHRVRAMALIHQKLYRTENLSQIDMRTYIQEVATQLSDSFDPEERIRFQYELSPLELDVSQAVPLGLIINEAITNAFKYAFPDDRSGTICVCLSQLETDRYLLQVKDNGVGLPTGIDLKKSHSMGANIMRGLSKQLGGNLEVTSCEGVAVSVHFDVFHPQAIRTQDV